MSDGKPVPETRAELEERLTRRAERAGNVTFVWILGLALAAAIPAGLWVKVGLGVAIGVVGLVLAFIGAYFEYQEGKLRLARALAEAGHHEAAVPLLKELRESDSHKDEAGYLVAVCYDRAGQQALARESYRDYLVRFDKKKESKRGAWVVEATVRLAALEAAPGAPVPAAQVPATAAPVPAIEVQAAARETAPGAGGDRGGPASAPPGVVCPFCKDGIDGDVLTAECAGCGTTHHLKCYDEQGGCAVYGCASSKVRAGARERAT